MAKRTEDKINLVFNKIETLGSTNSLKYRDESLSEGKLIKIIMILGFLILIFRQRKLQTKEK